MLDNQTNINMQEKLIYNKNIVITKDEIQVKYKNDFNSSKKHLKIDGFRKGFVPEKLIEKKYGSSIYQETVTELLNNKINDYLKEINNNIFGDIIVSKGPNVEELDINNQIDLEYEIKVGRKTDFDLDKIKGTYDKYSFNITDEVLQEKIKILLEKNPIYEVNESIETNTIIEFDLIDNDLTIQGNIIYDKIEDKELKNKLSGLKLSDKIEIDSEDSIAAYDELLKYINKKDLILSEIAKKYTIEIKNIEIIKERQIDLDFYNIIFSEKKDSITDEEFKERFKQFLHDENLYLTDLLDNQTILNIVINQLHFDFDDEYLKKVYLRGKDNESDLEHLQKDVKIMLLFDNLIKYTKEDIDLVVIIKNLMLHEYIEKLTNFTQNKDLKDYYVEYYKVNILETTFNTLKKEEYYYYEFEAKKTAISSYFKNILQPNEIKISEKEYQNVYNKLFNIRKNVKEEHNVHIHDENCEH